jgi:hypothetical protein
MDRSGPTHWTLTDQVGFDHVGPAQWTI